LGGHYTRFRAQVGQESSGSGYDLTLEIDIDGSRAFSMPISDADPPVPLDISVQGVNTLSLIEHASCPRIICQGFAVWGDATLTNG
jgi:hypothetical protein